MSVDKKHQCDAGFVESLKHIKNVALQRIHNTSFGLGLNHKVTIDGMKLIVTVPAIRMMKVDH